MFMIYKCNVCVCKPMSCLAEENESWIAGDNKILTVVGGSKSLTDAGD